MSELNANGRKALHLIAAADEAYNGAETWTERYPGSGCIQYVHWRTVRALTARGLVTATLIDYDDNGDGRLYPVNRLELTAAGRDRVQAHR